MSYNLFETSKNETTNSPIYELKVLHKGHKPLFMVYNVIFITFKKHFKPCFFHFKGLKRHFLHFKFVNWRIGEFVFFDIMNRLIVVIYQNNKPKIDRSGNGNLDFLCKLQYEFHTLSLMV